MSKKKWFFKTHSKSSALLISIAIHSILIGIAVFAVVFTISKRPDDDQLKGYKYDSSKKIPPSTPRGLSTAKKTPTPPTTLVTPTATVPKSTFNQISIPDVATARPVAITEAGGDLSGLLPTLNLDIIWGPKNSSGGNELQGTFYDLKQTRKGEPVQMTIDRFFGVLAGFVKGWNTGRLNDYYQSPVHKYATMFMIPTIPSSAATEAFDVSETVKPQFWTAYYHGMIAAPETGEYRFWGYGDDVLMVRINNKLVLDAGFADYRPKLQTGWESTDANNRKFPLGGQLLYVGDWFKLSPRQQVKMEVLIGDVGGLCSAQLLIEQRGKTYRQVPYNDGVRPVLPVFKLQEIPAASAHQISIQPNEATFDGPTFGTYKEQEASIQQRRSPLC